MAEIRLDLREADGDLPAVCMVCGEPATMVITKKLSWCPRWVFLLVLVHVLAMLIVALILTKKAHLRAPFCGRHRNHWLKRTLLASGAAVVLAGLAAVAIITACTLPLPQIAADIAFFASMAVAGSMALWLIVVWMLQSSAIRPTVITKTEIVLENVSDAFIRAVQAADQERWSRTEKKDRDDANNPSGVPPSPSNAIQKERTPRPGLDSIQE